MNLLIATSNPGKYKELVEALNLPPNIKLLSLKDIDAAGEAPEDYETFAENAQSKAQFYAEQTKIPTLADDSGLWIPAFPDFFGVRTRRTIQASDDMAWLTEFLEMMEPQVDKTATFVCALAFYDSATKKSFVIEGQTTGEIVDFPQTPLEPGIPVSSVFIPDGYDQVYSAMTKAQKAELSHRGKACAQMAEFLKNF